jgi:hypothetical protein
MSDYSGLTINAWPGTWSPNGDQPIVLDNEIRGGLRLVSGQVGDTLLDIPGQRLQDGMLVFLSSGYASGIKTYQANNYYQYRSLAGETRNTSTGVLPNSDDNWQILELSGGGGGAIAASLIDAQGDLVSPIIGQISALRFDTESGFDLVDNGGGEVIVKMNSTFKTWKVEGQEDLVAVGLDTMRFIAGTGIKIETDPTFDSTEQALTFKLNASLNDLLDVNLSTPPSIGQVLKFNGTSWTAAPDIGSASGGSGIGDASTLNGFEGSYYLDYNNFTNTPAPYTLPTASPTILGGVKIGENVNINQQGVISVPKGAGINKVIDIPDVNTDLGLEQDYVLRYNSGAMRWESKELDLDGTTLDGGFY